MSGVRLGEALESITAEVILWSAAPDRAGARQIATAMADLARHAHPGSALGSWLGQLAHWFATRDEDADGAAATDAMLASIDWASGAVAEHEGVWRVLADLGVSSESATERVEALNREAAEPGRPAPAPQPADSWHLQERDEVGKPTEPSGIGAADEAERLSPLPAPHREEPAAADGLIWVAVEERDLVVTTVHGEFLPRLMFLTEQPDIPHADPEAEFFVETVANALSVVGLESCSRLLGEAGRTALARGDIDALAELAHWLVQLTAWLGHQSTGGSTDVVAADEFAEAARNLARLARQDELADQVVAEIPRLRVGRSPNLLEKPRRTAREDDLDLAPAPDVIPAVLQGMLRELPGHADALITSLSAIAAGSDPAALERARRTAHTLKGDANTVGIRGLANLTHALEDIFVEVERRGGAWPDGLLAVVAEAADLAAAMADHVLGRGAAPNGALDLLERIYAVADAMERDEPAPEFVTSRPASSPAPRDEAPAAAPAATAQPESQADEVVTLPRSVVDRLLRLASESIALGNQLRGAVEANAMLQTGLGEEVVLVQNAGRALDEQVAFRGMAIAERRRKDIEIDPLELDEYNELYVVSRRVQETAADVRERLAELGEAGQRVESLLTRKLRVDEDLQSLVRRSRLVPVREHRARFERAVRQAARMVGKDVQFRLTGEALAVDKLLLDGLVEPLMHLLRNAVDHGIEDVVRRGDAGKPSTGTVALAFTERAQVLEIEVGDDGAGLDLGAIHRRAVRLGLIDDGEQPEETLKALLFRPGFSTRDAVTQVSGRGIGLDVVASRIRALGGTVSVDHTAGSGTRFRLRVPLAVGALQVALVPLGGHTQAIATDSFAGFQPIGIDQQRRSPDGAVEVLVDERWLPAVELSALLGVPGEHCAGRAAVGALVGPVGDTGVVLCPRIEALSLVVLESLAGTLPVIAGLRGAAVLGDGSAAPVIDLGEYWRTRDGDARFALESTPAAAMLPRIVVADDSLTIRQSLGDLLIDSGYRVELARDGLEALMHCEREVPAALLVDLEMPRMNGIELVSHLRKDPRYATIPIVMITSRTAERHRAMAETAGVDAVLAKPYHDDDVLQLLSSHLV